MSEIPFSQRFGLEQSKPMEDDFPQSARIALSHLVDDLRDRNYLSIDEHVTKELFRTGRFTDQEFDFSDLSFSSKVLRVLQKMTWPQVYIFCERVFDHLLQPAGYLANQYIDGSSIEGWVESESLSEVQGYYTAELNNLIAEENLAYHFVDGEFQKRGRAQTQNNFQRVGKVLGAPYLLTVRNLYNKARKFFDERPEPDSENCVKEAVCALEVCLEILTKKKWTGDFTSTIKNLQGNEPSQIPPPIAQGMIKLYGYRGSGKNVAHATLKGNRVLGVDAELVLNLVASYITYLVDLLSQPEDPIPF